MKGTIKLNREFRYAYNKGRKIVTPYIVMHFCKNGTKETKIGITVSTSIGGAVVRNRIKRLIREGYYSFESQTAAGYNIIFVARHKMNGASFDNVLSSMAHCLGKAKLL